MSVEAVQFAKMKIEHFQRKADHNKRESLFCLGVIVVFSLASPVLVMLGQGDFIGKLIPSCLSLAVAASTGWMQLRRPQTLWAIYRDSQRRIEDSLYKYEFNLAEFDVDELAKTRLLADSTRLVAWEAHARWLPLVPNPETTNRDSTERVASNAG